VQKVTWAASMVKKFRLVERPKSRPTKTNISMSEMPVMMSGFVMGMSVTVFMTVRYHLERSLFIPTAPRVPITVETAVAEAARSSVFFTDSRVLRSANSSSYHLRENPENTERLLPSLKEKISSTTMGAKRKTKIMPLYIFDDSFMLIPSVKSFGGEMLHDRHADEQYKH